MNSPKEDMKRIDELLKVALRREDAPPGFADRVMAQLEQQNIVQTGPERISWFRACSRPVARWATFAAVCASLITGGIHYRNLRREQAEGEAAKQQLMLALHIAGSKLQLARSKVNEIHASQPNREHDANRSRSKS